MSLGVFQNLNATDYFRTGLFTATTEATKSLVETGTSFGNRVGWVWLDRLGLWQCRATASASFGAILRFDPLLIDNTSASIQRIVTTSSPNKFFPALGTYVPSTGEQRLFASLLIGNDSWNVMDYNNPISITTADPFPFIGTLNTKAASGITSGDVGYYATNQRGEWIFFEGWDHDGSGNTVGTALVPLCDVRTAAGLQAETTALINLQTGAAVPIAGLPSQYTTSPLNEFQAGKWQDRFVRFAYVQWLADDDSTRTAPKGQLYFSSDNNAPIYEVKLVEWNPTGASGTPLRTHLRERYISQFTMDPQAPSGSFPGVSSNEMPSASANPGMPIRINRLNGRPTLIQSNTLATLATYNSVVYLQAVLETTPTAVVSALTKPNPRQTVTTNRIVTIATDAVGDLGERIAGEPVAWTLERISTRGEVLATTPTPGETVTVNNFPIDRNGTFPFAVKKDGVAMVETTEYSVNVSNGQITFVGPEPVGGSIYTADYGHPTVPATPAFGQLLNATATSDDNGEAFTRIKYADTDENAGFLDQITVDTV